MTGRFGRPETEAIVMFGGDDGHLETGFFKSPHPLFAVQRGRIKDGRIFSTISPLSSGESIYTEMQESGQFHTLPLQLLGSGYKA